MENTTAIGNYYTINHLTLATGLTDRTIRNYISKGLLTGEKINGLWHFTSEEVDAFIRHPAVWPSIQAKKNSMVYDFLLDTKKKNAEICIILDVPEDDPKVAAEYFCYTINEGNLEHIHFSFENVQGTPRLILHGNPAEALELVNGYYAMKSQMK